MMSKCMGGLAAVVAFFAGAGQGEAAFSFAQDLAANDPVETITVQIKVGEGGGELGEPVGLDLGLGFLFWLHPVGRAEGEKTLWGAMPPVSGAGRQVRAGESASFTFERGAEAGQDALRTSAQLLAGVRVSDISRIGFASRGSNDWVLASYDIKINGKPFAANNEVGAKAREKQEAARGRLAELDPQITPLQTEAGELVALVEAGLAADADKQRMRDVEEKLAPLVKEKRRLRRQIDGIHPWFIEPDFRSPWREGQEVGDVQVTLVTAAHTGAETGNLVYFRTGGHKYLVGSPANPLDPAAGPRVIALDLVAGPLTAADLRGYAVGMLGNAEPFDAAPDRWHPQRLMVEVDGRVVYDSEENDIDRMSLEAIRVIPPAHFDGAGKVAQNIPNARETFVWEAGKGTGLDLVKGGAAELPPEGGPGYPMEEPGLGVGAPFGEGAMVGDEGWGGFADDYPPFPGEGGYGPGWGGGWEDDWGPGWGPGWDGGFGPSWLDVLVGVLDALAPLAPGLDPPPVGEPFQVTAVRMTPPADPAGTFAIEWEVTGDAGSIKDFTVLILPVRPDHPNPIDFGAPLAELTHVSSAARDLGTGLNHYPAAGERPYLYVIPVVIAHATDDAADAGVGDHTGLGLALPYVFSATDPTQLNVFSVRESTGVPFAISPSDPGGPGPAAWLAGEVPSHRSGLLFGSTTPGQNLVIRPGPGPGQDEIYVMLLHPAVPSGRYRFLFHLGFEGESGGANSVDGDVIGLVDGPGAPPPHWYPVLWPIGFPPPPWPQALTHAVSTPGGDEPMPVIQIQQPAGAPRVIDTVADAGPAGPYGFGMVIKIEGAAVDPAHPCVLFGLRLVEVP